MEGYDEIISLLGCWVGESDKLSSGNHDREWEGVLERDLVSMGDVGNDVKVEGVTEWPDVGVYDDNADGNSDVWREGLGEGKEVG